MVVLPPEGGAEAERVGIAGEAGNASAAIVQPDIRTCSGAVMHVTDRSLNANYTVEVREIGDV